MCTAMKKLAMDIRCYLRAVLKRIDSLFVSGEIIVDPHPASYMCLKNSTRYEAKVRHFR